MDDREGCRCSQIEAGDWRLGCQERKEVDRVVPAAVAVVAVVESPPGAVTDEIETSRWQAVVSSWSEP